jgi:endonuclease/exonuclease/phosphatase family metal-dependent hydrolase
MRLILPVLLLLLGGCGPRMGVPVVLTGESPNVTIMTFNVKWLVDSEELVARLKSKRIWGLESRDEESEIAAHHEAVANTIIRHSPDIICLQEVINEAAAKRLVQTLQSKGANYNLHYMNSRDSFTEQDVVFLTSANSTETIEAEKATRSSHPRDPSKCTILRCRIGEQHVALVGIHLKSIPDKLQSVTKRNSQVSAVAQDLRKLHKNGYYPIVLGDFNDWDGDVEDANPKATPLPSSRVFSSLKDYHEGGGKELINCLKFVEGTEKRYTYDYKGSKTVLDHILIPSNWEGNVVSVTIDHESPTDASDHWPLVLRMDASS